MADETKNSRLKCDKISRELLLKILEKQTPTGRDAEYGHMDADAALLRYIDDDEVWEIWGRIGRWYS